MALIDTVMNMITRKEKQQSPEKESRSVREAALKDRAGMVISIFALLLSINTFYGGKLSSIIMNNTISANNQWSWYQAQNVRSVIYETAAIQSKDDATKSLMMSEKDRMESDKNEIAERAKKLEAERDDAKKRSPWISYANTAYQLSIVLLSASILAVSMPMFFGSFVVAGIGILLSAQGVFLFM